MTDTTSEPLRVSLDRDCWYTYWPAWLSRDEADAMLAALTAESVWVQRPIYALGKEIIQPRLMDWAGDLPYRYSGQELEPRVAIPRVAELAERVSAVAGEQFNHVLLNLYRDGRDSIAMHADNEPELGWEPVIASLSMGAERRFVIQHKKKRSWRRSIVLQHGSLLVMAGAFQRQWRHALPRQADLTQPRINVTFRRLFGPPGWRPERRTPPPTPQ